MAKLYLGLAILFETLATSFLKKTNGFTVILPTVLVIIGYALAFFFLSHATKVIPIGIAYAIWAGIGIVLIALIGYFAFNQSLDLWALIGILLILSGVLVINLLSKSVS